MSKPKASVFVPDLSKVTTRGDLSSTCAWPLWGSGETSGQFCGHRASGYPSPYCGYHKLVSVFGSERADKIAAGADPLNSDRGAAATEAA